MAGASPYVVRWMQAILYPAFRKAAKDAYRDLSEAKFYGGTADTTGYAFVRRYICADGSFDGINYAYPTGSPAVRHETEADPELQVLKITREGKKDVVMVNWQAHVAHAAGTYKASVSSDFVHYLRAGVEGQMGVQFAYYNGASGNLNLSTRFPELRKYSGSTWIDVGKALVSKVKEACSNVTELKTGEIKVATGEVEGVFREVDAARLAQAREYNYASSDAERAAVLAKYKFHSRYEASKIVELGSKTTDSEKISLYAITFGEIAFAGAPYEMFDTSGMEIKNASPYKMTFICAYTNGAQGYMPSFDAFSRGGYEVHVANYVQGTAEKCVTELLRLLQAVA